MSLNEAFRIAEDSQISTRGTNIKILKWIKKHIKIKNSVILPSKEVKW